jgi:hypothetical protein
MNFDLNMNKNISQNINDNDNLILKKKGKIENKSDYFFSNPLLNDDSNKENELKYSNIDITKRETMNKIALRNKNKTNIDKIKEKDKDKHYLNDNHGKININNDNKKGLNNNLRKKGKCYFFLFII